MNKLEKYQLTPVCIVNNVHGLLIYYLYNTQYFFDTLFVVSDGISVDVQKKLKHTIRIPSFSHSPKLLRIILRAIYYQLANFFLKFKKDNKIVYGHDHLFYSQLFIKKAKRFILLEDGLANYSEHDAAKGGKIRKIIFGSSGPFFGWSKQVSSVVLSGIVDIPDKLKNKTTLVDINMRWNELAPQQKQRFINIFSAEPYIALKKVVIFTQPFSEDAMMSEAQKINIYKKIYNHYRQIFQKDEICIKSHPREHTDYSQYFDCVFIKSKIPGQIMILNDRPEILVTIYSSVGYIRDNIKTHIWGTEFDSFLLEKVGYFEGNYTGWTSNE
uniref:WepA n=1 Tax=Cronobacter turicensis TaxID=413502 RepID=I7EEJ4_9ENTR|nr:WepA [Cronobacter turicensis]